jgi:uncharacterized membrane protein
MNANQVQAEIKRIHRQLGQLRRRLVWNYDRIIELEQRQVSLAAELPQAQARGRFVAELFSEKEH